MKKALIIAYAKKNLGDDLFIHVLVNRYKNTKFFLCSRTVYNKDCFKFRNLKLINPYIVKSLNNISNNLNNHKLNCNNLLSRVCDATVLIGGSMFIQNSDMNIIKHQVKERFLHLKNKYYILGSNFGPYKDKEYHNLHSEVFEKAEDVSFREEHSYKLFEDLKNTKYASDIVFSLDVKNINVVKSKKVIISVIDLSFRKELFEYKEIYEQKIKETIEYLVKNGYEVTLMSFCKFEGDENAIRNILKLVENSVKSKVFNYNYDGNIDEALSIIADSEVIFATRFHAMILGLLFGKTVIPIVYSKKTLNVMKDLDFKGDYIKIEEFNNFDISSLNLNYTLDISKEILDSQRHFEKLDLYLEK